MRDLPTLAVRAGSRLLWVPADPQAWANRQREIEAVRDRLASPVRLMEYARRHTPQGKR